MMLRALPRLARRSVGLKALFRPLDCAAGYLVAAGGAICAFVVWVRLAADILGVAWRGLLRCTPTR